MYQRLTSRRRFLAGAAATFGVAILAACAPAPAPTATPAPKPTEAPKPTTAPAAPTATPAAAAKPTEAPKPTAAAKPTEAPTAAAAKPTTQAAQAPVPKLKGKLVFWGHDIHPIDNLVPGYKQRQPDVQFDSQHIGEWLTKFKATLASGQDVPDLVWLEATDIQALGAQGVLLDVTDIIKPIADQFAKAKVVEVFIVKKQQYVAIPSDLALVGLWYRADLLQKAGVKPPEKGFKFDPDFLKMAVDVNKATGAAAFLLPKNGWAWPFEIFLSQLGGSINTLDGTKVTVDDDKGIQAMTLLKQLYDTKTALDTDWLQAPYWGAVKAGKIATDFMPAWMRGFVRGETKTAAEGLGQWRIAPMPELPNGVSRTAQIGGAALTSTKFTKVPDIVKDFMLYGFATMEGCKAIGDFGNIPPYLPYLESDVFQGQKDPIFGDQAYAKVWAELAKELSPDYARTAVFAEADTIITQNMMPILRGEVKVADGMKKIGDLVRQANARYQ